MVDKKVYWAVDVCTHAADALWDWKCKTLITNSYQSDMKILNSSGEVEILSNGKTKFDYVLIGINRPDSKPFDTTTFSGITTDAELQTFLDSYRDRIWMTLGGIVNSSADEDRLKVLEFDAKTKRALNNGEALVMVVGARNYSAANGAGSSDFSVDMTIFYE